MKKGVRIRKKKKKIRRTRRKRARERARRKRKIERERNKREYQKKVALVHLPVKTITTTKNKGLKLVKYLLLQAVMKKVNNHLFSKIHIHR